MKHKQSCDLHVRAKVGCDECLRRKVAYNKRLQLINLRGARLSAPAAVVRQWLRDLRALGYSVRDLSDATGLVPATIWRLSTEETTRWVQLGTYHAVEKAWLRLREYPARSDGRAARSAARNGWTPPPLPEPPDVPVLDDVAIERAVSGDRNVTLTSAEVAEALNRLLARGANHCEAARVLGISERRVQRILSGETRNPHGRRTA